MVDLLRGGEPISPEQCAGLLADCGVQLPVTVSIEDLATIVDADNELGCVVDVHNEREDEDVKAITLMIVKAINACADLAAGADREAAR